jgi:threonine synthase
VKYVSTRGEAPEIGFEDVLLTGLARDGGLYVPKSLPVLTLEEFGGLAFADAAFRVMHPFIGGEIDDAVLQTICTDAYATFSHSATCPLVQIGTDEWVLELFHGPTLAFKDVAMQVLGRLMDHVLTKRGGRATVIGATSGDTGSAAIEAFRGREAIDIFILHPHGRTSDVQRKQMTTAVEDNVHNIAIEGSFDDCQALVKALFNDLPLRDRLQLAGVNSINWARIMAQVTYYVTAAAALGASDDRKLCFSVPTGNFGDVLAGHVAARMGLPVAELVIGTNSNDILVRALTTGVYEPRQTLATQSPSMDIQVSSNFERLLFEIAHRKPETIRGWMSDLKTKGRFEFDAAMVTRRNSLVPIEAHAVDEAATTQTIAEVYRTTGYLADPHTAVGIAAARRAQHRQGQPMITLGTAHPAKFPAAVERAIGRKPDVPERLARQMAAKERFDVLPNDFAKVAAFIDTRARLGRGAA